MVPRHKDNHRVCQTYFLSAVGVELLIPNELRLALKRASCSDKLFLGRPAIPSLPGQRHSSWKWYAIDQSKRCYF